MNKVRIPSLCMFLALVSVIGTSLVLGQDQSVEPSRPRGMLANPTNGSFVPAVQRNSGLTPMSPLGVINVPIDQPNIQAAIDAASNGDIINVYPSGSPYNTEEANGRDPLTGGAGSSDYNIFVNKSVTIQGVDASGNPITNYADVVARVVPLRLLTHGNNCGIFVQADGVTISGLEIDAKVGNPGYNFKTIEVVGNNFTMKYCKVNGLDETACIYVDDVHFNSGTNTSYVESYRIESNYINGGGPDISGIRISNGPGWTGSVANRIIANNTFYNNCDAIAFVGPGADPWDVYPVGTATISGNSFSVSDRRHVIAWGQYAGVQGYAEPDWTTILSSNTFDKGTIIWTPANAVRGWDLAPQFFYVKGLYSGIKRYAVPKSQAGDRVQVLSGTYAESGTIDINHSLTIEGATTPSLPKVQTAGATQATYLFNATAPGVTLKNLEIEKTNKLDQNIIYVGGSNFQLDNCKIHGQFVIGEGDVSRAMVMTGGLTGLQITGNEIYSLRQPAYISGPTTGNITNNFIHGTKGWVLEGGDMTFTGNTWGVNVFDIAILNNPANVGYYLDIVAMSNANNDAVIEDQRVSPAVLSVVYVDGSTSFSTDLGGKYHPYPTIAPAIARAVDGGKILVAAGAYNTNNLHLTRSVTIDGESTAGTIINAGGQIAFYLENSNITIRDLTITAALRAVFSTWDGTGFSFINVNFNSYSDRGIELQHSALGLLSNVLVDNCVFTPNGDKVAIRMSSSRKIDGFQIVNSTFNGGSQGFYEANDGGQGFIHNLNIHGCTFNNFSFAAVYMEEAQDVLVENNLFDGNARGFYIYKAYNVSSIANVVVRHNDFLNVANRSLALAFYGTQAVSSVNIYENKMDGGTRLVYFDTDPGVPGLESIHINRNSITNIIGDEFFAPYFDAGEAWVLDVSNNYWGSTDPGQVTVEPGATAVPINFFDFTPMINSAIDTDGGVRGFVPDLSQLSAHMIGGQSGAVGRIQEGINLVSASTVNVLPGTYVEGPQVLVNKNVTIIGADKLTTIITPSANTGNSGDARGWWLINPGFTFNLSNVTLDGAGKLVNIGVLSKGAGTIDNNIIKNIGYNPSGPDYAGRGIAFYEVNMSVSNNMLSNIGRIGIYTYGAGVTNAAINGNTYTGKGTGNWLDYAIEVEGGAHATLANNLIADCKGVASVDGSTSAGVLATTYFAPGTQATITSNNFTNNTSGITAGYDASDVTTIVAHNNNFVGNTFGIESSNPVVNATLNWWGSATGPTHASNPGGTGDAVTDYVNFNPWIGMPEAVSCPSPNTDYDFAGAGVTLNFSTMPSGGGDVTISKFLATPPNPPYPNPPAGASYISLYLDFSSTMPNNSFTVTVTVDVSGIAGFGATSQVMYFNTTTNVWVPIGGTYNAGDQTFTFTTTHFTPFSFINTPAAAYNLYVSGSQAVAASGTVYANTTWGASTPYEPNDWSWTGSQSVSVYVVPQAGTTFGASDITIEWDPTLLVLATPVNGTGVEFGSVTGPTANGLFASDQSYSTFREILLPTGTNRVVINCSRTDNKNFGDAGEHAVVSGDYIAKLNFQLLKPGHASVSIIGADFRYFTGLTSAGVFVSSHQAEVKAYLGDVATYNGIGNPIDESTGDGKINIADLTTWSASYWSGVVGYPNGLTFYKVKYDIGPTQNGSIFSLPVPDTKIQFEDLVIFSIMYGKSAANQLPKTAVDQGEPIAVGLGSPVVVGNETRIPVHISGGVVDLRALSLEVNGQFGNFIGAERGALLQNYETPVMVMARADGNSVFVDLGVVGLDAQSIGSEGEIVILRFAGNAALRVKSADGRGSANNKLAMTISKGNSGIPTKFDLVQNYPNPFNPSTTIEYEVIAATHVEIAIYNIIGQKVATLVDEVKDAGFFNVVWNGRDSRNQPLSSGVYFYSMNAGEFKSVKKMMLMK